MNSLLVYESLCGGGYAGQDLPPGLLHEGYAMWSALVHDLHDLAGLELVASIDSRVSPPRLPRLQCLPVSSAGDAETAWSALLPCSDAALVIAPELDGELTRRVQAVHAAGRGGLLSSVADTAAASDKWICFERFLAADLPTPNTVLAEQNLPSDPPGPFPLVIKPRFGAGSAATFFLRDRGAWDHLRTNGLANLLFPAVLQPWLPGEPVSIACVIDPQTGSRTWLPPVRQQLTGGHFCGGEFVAEVDLEQNLAQIAAAALDLFPGLRGYVGCDFLVGDTGNTRLQLLEINPRLTSSYHGYRAWAGPRIAERMLGLQNSCWPERPRQPFRFVLPQLPADFPATAR